MDLRFEQRALLQCMQLGRPSPGTSDKPPMLSAHHPVQLRRVAAGPVRGKRQAIETAIGQAFLVFNQLYNGLQRAATNQQALLSGFELP